MKLKHQPTHTNASLLELAWRSRQVGILLILLLLLVVNNPSAPHPSFSWRTSTENFHCFIRTNTTPTHTKALLKNINTKEAKHPLEFARRCICQIDGAIADTRDNLRLVSYFMRTTLLMLPQIADNLLVYFPSCSRRTSSEA